MSADSVTPEQGASISKQEISQFTKATEAGRKIRHDTAVQIHQERADRFQAQRSIPELDTQIQSATGRIGQLSINIESQQQALLDEGRRLDQLEAELAKRSSSLINRILYGISGLISAPKLEEQIQAVSASFVQLKQGVQQAQTEQEQLEEQSRLQQECLRQAQERTALNNARAILDGFYEQQGQRLQAFREDQRKKEEERRIRDIRNISSKYKVYFIHGIRPDKVNPNNPGLEKNTKWQSKLDILLGYDLDLSSSTIREGDRPENMFSRIGVILRKGTVEDAHAGDVGTQATETGGKVTGLGRMADSQEDIERAIFYRRSIAARSGVSDWNEFIIGGDIQFAGLYVCLDRRNYDRMLEIDPNEFKRWNGYDLLTQDRIREVVNVVQGINIPLYVIQEGVVYEAEYGIENGQHYIRKKGQPITPEELSNSTFSLSSGEMEAARNRTSGCLKIRPRPKKEEQQTEYILHATPAEVSDQATEIKRALENPNFTPERLIAAFKRNPSIKELYESSAGVWEDYSIEQHTLMVMKQFEKYFSQGFGSPIMSRDQFRVMLALHDIGKSLVMKYRGGDKEAQHKFTDRTIKQILLPLGFTWREIDIISAMACQDTIGDFIKDRGGRLKPELVANNIKYSSQQLRINSVDMSDLMLIYYMCDAGSYTRDAGGKQSLDSLFNFGRDTIGKPTIMEFALDQTRRKIADLKMYLGRN